MGFDYAESVSQAEVNDAVRFDESPYFRHDRVRIYGMFVNVIEHDQVDRLVGERQGVAVTIGERDARTEASVGRGQTGSVDVNPGNPSTLLTQYVGYVSRRTADIQGSQSDQISHPEEVLGYPA